MARLGADGGCVGTVRRLVHLGHPPARWPSCGVLCLRTWTSRCIEVTGEVASSASYGGASNVGIVCDRMVRLVSSSSLRTISAFQIVWRVYVVVVVLSRSEVRGAHSMAILGSNYAVNQLLLT